MKFKIKDEDLLATRDLAEAVRRLPIEMRLPGMKVEERLKGLEPEERLKGLTPEELLKALETEELKKLKKLLDELNLN